MEKFSILKLIPSLPLPYLPVFDFSKNAFPGSLRLSVRLGGIGVWRVAEHGERWKNSQFSS
jgi:hypothetical protein